MDKFVSFWNMLLGVILSFRITDLIDILIISYIVYKMIQIVRETQAAHLIKGLLFLFAFALIAKILNLKTVGSITSNVFFWGPLAGIVLFQPELRRILERVGRTKMGTRFKYLLINNIDENEEKIERAIYKVANACEDLSRTKTGALIVFERKTKLGDVIETGVNLNADISEELIGNLFFKNSPLHDGAVIVRDGKIIAASCFLPKPSKEEYISRSLGSRHRAAIGMSENSDALVLVVSEETGSISIANEGKLKRHLNRTGMISYLQDGLIPKHPNESSKSIFGKAKKK